MKLIVDISDDLYKVIKTDKYGLHKGKMYDIIRNAVPFDSLKVEIENRSYGVANDSVIQGEIYERHNILEIIDRYMEKGGLNNI